MIGENVEVCASVLEMVDCDVATCEVCFELDIGLVKSVDSLDVAVCFIVVDIEGTELSVVPEGTLEVEVNDDVVESVG